MGDWSRLFDPHMHPEMMVFVSQVVVRLLLAAVLGGAIGLERELKRRPAGLRTNLFICFGAALFTILSERLAGEMTGDHTRIAAQIIPGIGFIGAGSILHSKGSISGLTSAATIFVVAAIGMAAGGGLFVAAIFATVIVLLALAMLGWAEQRFGYKPLAMSYEAEGGPADALLAALNRVLEAESLTMQSIQVLPTEQGTRILFTLEAVREQHLQLMKAVHTEAAIQRFLSLTAMEQE